MGTGSIVILLAVIAVVTVTSLLRMPRGELGGVDVTPGRPFHLRVVPRVTGRLRLCLAYDLAYEGAEDGYELDGRVAVTRSGAALWSDDVHLRVGRPATSQPLRGGEEARFKGGDSWDVDAGRRATFATVILGGVEVASAMDVVEVTGTLAPGPRTRARSLRVALTR